MLWSAIWATLSCSQGKWRLTEPEITKDPVNNVSYQTSLIPAALGGDIGHGFQLLPGHNLLHVCVHCLKHLVQGDQWPEGRRHSGLNREDEAEYSTFLHRHGVNTLLNILHQWNWFDYLHADLDHLLDLIGPPKDHDNLDQLHWLLLAASEPWPAPRRSSWVSCRAGPGWTRSTPRPPPGVSTSSLVIFLSVKILTYLRDTSAISYFTNVLKNEILDNRCRPFYSIPKPQNDEVRWWPNWTFGLLCVWDRVSGDWTGLWLGNKTMYFSLHLSKAKIEGSRHVCAP